MKKIFQIIIYIFAIIGFVLVSGYFAIKFKWTNEKSIVDHQSDFFQEKTNSTPQTYVWSEGNEWQTFKSALVKDKDVINEVAKETDVSPKIIASVLAVEQLRLFFTEREIFEKAFAPLKILGTQSQFSWGVMGIKQETAISVEENLKNKNSDFYPGEKYENLLDFKTADHDTERFNRIVDEHDRYYAYLYGALYIKEVEAQWKKAGSDISNRPEILATLYNIGFQNSKPKANPDIGGAVIQIANKEYSFGGLAGEVYYSGKLSDIFLI